MSSALPVWRIIKFDKNILFWTFMLTVEAPRDHGPYAYGSGRHREWRLSWWRTK